MLHPALPLMPDADLLSLAQILDLRQGRAHELCGPARRLLALWALAQGQGPVLWIRPRWSTERLHPQGVLPWLAPERLIFLDAAREAEALACSEEALRSGAVGAVVTELATPPPMTPLRRLHLAAEVGLARRPRQAGLLALILTPEDGGAAGVESRWHLAPCPAPPGAGMASVAPHWRLRRLRARMAPPATWEIADRSEQASVNGPDHGAHPRLRVQPSSMA